MLRLLTSTAACVCGIVMAGCGFHHPMPVQGAYDRVALGHVMPNDLKLPSDARKTQQNELSGMFLNHEWEHDTGAGEWAAFLTDQAGRVIAKRCQTRGEEGTLPTMQFKRIDSCVWQIQPELIDSKNPADSLRSVCARLSFEKTGLPQGEYDMMRLAPSPEGRDVDANELIDAFERLGISLNEMPFGRYSTTAYTHGTWPFHEKTTRGIRLRSDGSVELTVEHRIDVSLLSWAAAGYAHAATHGGELP